MMTFNNSNAVRRDKRAVALVLEIESRNPDCELSFAIASDCLIARVFDDFAGYLFTYPRPLSAEADEAPALREITLYCLKENISETLSEVPLEKLPLALRSVRHSELHAMDFEGELFAVEIKNELSMLPPELYFDFSGLCFELPSQKYADGYFSLTKDKEHNKYYGYEITDDIKDASAADMVAEMLREFELNRALTLFVTQDGDFIGEATLYDFDGRGSAEISFRVARERTRMGYGGKILEGLIEISREIGLLALKARARKDNEISLSLLKKHGFAEAGAEDSVVFFKQDLSE